MYSPEHVLVRFKHSEVPGYHDTDANHSAAAIVPLQMESADDREGAGELE